MVFLQGVGVSTSLAVRIYKQYADASIGVVRNEPYRLATDVWGIGFKTADTIAQAVGIPPDSPQRVKAGLQFTLVRGDLGRALLPAGTGADQRGDQDPAGRYRPGDRVFGRAGHRGGGGPGADPRRGDRGTDGRDLPGAVPPRRDLPGRPAAAAVPDRHRPAASVRRAGLGHGAGLAAPAHRHRVGARAGSGGAPGADREGGRAHRRAGLRQELHRPVDRHPRGGEERQDRAGRAHRPGREAARPS